MQTFGFKQFGDPKVFEELTIPKPELKKGRVIVQTSAFAMNPFDSKLRRGLIPFKKAPNFPLIPGSDVAGTVVDLASDVTEFQIGDPVIGRTTTGSYAEFVSVPHLKLVHKPDSIPFSEAAGVPNAGVTAYDLLKSALQLENVTSILVLGGSGVVGSFVIQIAKAMDLFVATTASQKNADFVKKMGVDLFIPTDQLTKRNFLDDAPVDVLIDATPQAFKGNNTYRWLKSTGQLASLNGFSNSFQSQSSKQTIIDFNDANYHQNKKALTYLVELISHNQLKVPIAKVFPFSLKGIVEGQQLLDTHHSPGKIIVAKKTK